MNLFESSEATAGIQLDMVDGEVWYYPGFFDTETADSYYEHLLKQTPWQQDEIKVFGQTHMQPRLTALYGNNGKSYSYSNITMHPHPFSPELKAIKDKVEQASEVQFTTVLLNLYRNGQDSNGWHSDDEKELGRNPFIASVSFGTKRIFHFKHKQDNNLRHKLYLEHGSLLLMKGATQHHWKHQLPKSKRITTPRINLTFRVIA